MTSAALAARLSAQGEFRGRVYDNVLETIGATPMVRLSRLAARHGVVQAHDRDVLLPRALLRLNQPRRAVDADDQAPGDLRVEGAAVAGLLHAQNPPDPWGRWGMGHE